MSHPQPPPLPDYRDLRFCLILFGVFLVLGGGLCLLLAAFLLVLPALPLPKGEVGISYQMMGPAAVFYVLLGIAGVWLGIGSILCRRWARTLLLLANIFWLVCGTMGFLFMLFFMGEMREQMQITSGGEAPPPSILLIVQLISLVTAGIIYVVIPGIGTWFYSHRSTRLTCEAHDPKVRWTDRLPTPLLGLILLNGFMAVSFAGMAIFLPVFPAFGTYLSGISAMILMLLIGGIYTACTWGLAHRRLAFWWISLITILLVAASYTSTFLLHGLMPMYELLDFDEAMLAVLRESPMVQSKSMGIMTCLYVIPFLWLLLYCKRWVSLVPGGQSTLADL